MVDVTQILNATHMGQTKALDQLLPLVYEELRQLAQRQLAQEKPGQTLQPSALVHEAYLRLVTNSGFNTQDSVPGFENRRYFFAAAAEAMRHILVDQARRKQAVRHGGALDHLTAHDPLKDELVKLRYFAGFTNAETLNSLASLPKAPRNTGFMPGPGLSSTFQLKSKNLSEFWGNATTLFRMIG